jgi:hypothetical protein
MARWGVRIIGYIWHLVRSGNRVNIPPVRGWLQLLCRGCTVIQLAGAYACRKAKPQTPCLLHNSKTSFASKVMDVPEYIGTRPSGSWRYPWQITLHILTPPLSKLLLLRGASGAWGWKVSYYDQGIIPHIF